MRRRPYSRRQFAFLPMGCHVHCADVRARWQVFDQLGMAKCPRCGAPLVARLNRFGPYFQCRCPQRKAA